MTAGLKFSAMALTAAALFFAPAAVRAHGNEHAEVKAAVGSAKISITYNRPTLKGRDLSKLIHPGDLWRMGADIPTTLETDEDLDFGAARVPKGKYILLARFVQPGEWALVISTKDRMHYEPSAKVAEVPLQVEEIKDPVEELAIQVTNKGGHGVLEISWGGQRLLTTFSPAK